MVEGGCETEGQSADYPWAELQEPSKDAVLDEYERFRGKGGPAIKSLEVELGIYTPPSVTERLARAGSVILRTLGVKH